jgi:hypothetical protein
MIEIKTEAFPKKWLKAVCNVCGFVVSEIEWESYPDYRNKKSKLVKKYTFCQKCGAVNEGVPKWIRVENGDWQAKCKDGDFLIWKYGSSYKWRYRTYGKLYADQIGFSKTIDQAKKACERHEGWKGAGQAV